MAPMTLLLADSQYDAYQQWTDNDEQSEWMEVDWAITDDARNRPPRSITHYPLSITYLPNPN
ncbi:MAG: hypothetical protein HC837_18680 [Chloroflexaceae bacterium]|nr:hypothetical protein [Chloroflexaceae bacterium]